MRRFSDIADAVIFSREESEDTPQRIAEEILAVTERDGDISTVTAIFRNAGTVYYSEEKNSSRL